MAEKSKTFVPKKWCGAGCGASIKQDEFMCRKHWLRLPEELRDRIWKLYRERNWLLLIEAHNEAKHFVAAKEAAERKIPND
jgi:hypothetical protein